MVVQHQVAGRDTVVVCIDREQRSACAPELASAVREALVQELIKQGRAGDGVHVVIADRAFEAWILADAKGLHQRGVFRQRPAFNSFEGQLGAGGKKGVVELVRLLGRSYRKTVDGPRLFTLLDFRLARRHKPGDGGSRSLDKFLRAVGI